MVLEHLIVSFHCHTHMQLFIKMYPYESLTPMSETTLPLEKEKKKKRKKRKEKETKKKKRRKKKKEEEDKEEEEKAFIL